MPKVGATLPRHATRNTSRLQGNPARIGPTRGLYVADEARTKAAAEEGAAMNTQQAVNAPQNESWCALSGVCPTCGAILAHVEASLLCLRCGWEPITVTEE